MKTNIRLSKKHQWTLSLVKEQTTLNGSKPWYYRIHALHILILGVLGMLSSIFIADTSMDQAINVLSVSIVILVGAVIRLNTNYKNIGK